MALPSLRSILLTRFCRPTTYVVETLDGVLRVDTPCVSWEQGNGASCVGYPQANRPAFDHVLAVLQDAAVTAGVVGGCRYWPLCVP